MALTTTVMLLSFMHFSVYEFQNFENTENNLKKKITTK
jgi:hypothetical protein